MDNFNLKKFLVENKLTYNSKLLSEGFLDRLFGNDEKEVTKQVANTGLNRSDNVDLGPEMEAQLRAAEEEKNRPPTQEEWDSMLIELEPIEFTGQPLPPFAHYRVVWVIDNDIKYEMFVRNLPSEKSLASFADLVDEIKPGDKVVAFDKDNKLVAGPLVMLDDFENYQNLKTLKPLRYDRKRRIPPSYNFKVLYKNRTRSMTPDEEAYPRYELYLKNEPNDNDMKELLKLSPEEIVVGGGIDVIDRNGRVVNSIKLLDSAGRIAKPGDLSPMTV